MILRGDSYFPNRISAKGIQATVNRTRLDESIYCTVNRCSTPYLHLSLLPLAPAITITTTTKNTITTTIITRRNAATITATKILLQQVFYAIHQVHLMSKIYNIRRQNRLRKNIANIQEYSHIDP